MPNQPLPEPLRRRFKVSTVDEMWYKLLTEGNFVRRRLRYVWRLFPSNPRCTHCHRPFAGIGGALMRHLMGMHKSAKNPRYDEVTALFIPGFTGQEHARRAVEAGQSLLRVTGHAEPGGPWVPVGVGIHTGTAWVGSIIGASGAGADFTALGDNVNIAARLASKAGAGEVLASRAACDAARLETEGLEKRDLELKGKSALVSVRVLHAA